MKGLVKVSPISLKILCAECLKVLQDFDDLDYTYQHVWELFYDGGVVGEWTTEKIYVIGK